MLDLTQTTEAKSDQLNADDLIGNSKVLKVTKVSKGSAEQPIVINYEGDNGKPYKPSKGMRRVLVAAWGKDGEQFVGRSMKVYNDATVKWAGKEVGGIRISEMSHLDNAIVIPLTQTRGKKTAFTVKPLTDEAPAPKKEKTMKERQEQTIQMLKDRKIEVTKDAEEIIYGTKKPEDLKTIFESMTKEA